MDATFQAVPMTPLAALSDFGGRDITDLSRFEEKTDLRRQYSLLSVKIYRWCR
jgi:hypothetical protein